MLVNRRIIFLLGVTFLFTTEVSAQLPNGFFVEPKVQTTQLLNDQTLFVGISAGDTFEERFSFEIGLSFLTIPVHRNPGPYFGDKIDGLNRLSLGLRYRGPLPAGFCYEIGGLGTIGALNGNFCGGTDSCVGGGFVTYGGGPELGLKKVMRGWLSIYFRTGYTWREIDLLANGMRFEIGVRLSP